MVALNEIGRAHKDEYGVFFRHRPGSYYYALSVSLIGVYAMAPCLEALYAFHSVLILLYAIPAAIVFVGQRFSPAPLDPVEAVRYDMSSTCGLGVVFTLYSTLTAYRWASLLMSSYTIAMRVVHVALFVPLLFSIAQYGRYEVRLTGDFVNLYEEGSPTRRHWLENAKLGADLLLARAIVAGDPM